MAKFNERYWLLWDEARDRNYKVSRQAFADSMGVTAGQSNGWLDNGNLADCDSLLKVAKHADVSVSWLVGETEMRNLHSIEMLKGLSTHSIDELVCYAGYLQYKEKSKR